MTDHEFNRKISDAVNENVPWKAIALDAAFAIFIGFVLALVMFLGLSGAFR